MIADRAWLAHVPGLKLVMARYPADADARETYPVGHLVAMIA